MSKTFRRLSHSIYTIGGRLGIGSAVPNVEEYDPATDTWTRKADMPAARHGFSASVVNDRAYIIGGCLGRYFSTVEEYDPANDTWTKKADMPTARAFLSTSVANGRIYAFGGAIPPREPGPFLTEILSAVEEYTPEGFAVSPQGKLATMWGKVKCR